MVNIEQNPGPFTKACPNCGATVKFKVRTCPNCGAECEKVPDSGIAIASFVLSFFSLFWPMGVLSIITALLAIKSDRFDRRIRFAVAAIIIAAVLVTFILLFKQQMIALIKQMINAVTGGPIPDPMDGF